ncbi:MAG: DUF551 domain-containing protein [Eubacteriales bacterium]|nr:DUF551 domain-containing protein [Eubacteriales bacterium]
MERLTIPDKPIEGGVKRAVIDVREVRKHAMTIYWRLKKYEDTGIDPERFAEIDRSYQEMAQELAELRKQKWIPVTERLPDTDDYIMVSFKNYMFPDIARYEKDEDGGAFYPGDEEKSYVQYGLFVNAWMPLPEPYKETKDDE